MKKVILFLLISALITPCTTISTQASLVSDQAHRVSQKKIYNKEIKQIKKLLQVHNVYANKHDLENIKALYSDNYINNDGFNKEIYFKSIKDTWDECKDLTYSTKIISTDINGDFASVTVEEKATGTVYEQLETTAAAGEIHSKSTGIYHLAKINGKWLISGETLLKDESSLLYGESRFMNIELEVPSQVAAGESYTATVKVDTNDSDTYILGSIDKDLVTYPTQTPNPPMRAMPKSKVLERIIKANTDNIPEYAVSSLAISRAKDSAFGDYKVYMVGLACLMKRINVIPKNNYIKTEEK